MRGIADATYIIALIVLLFQLPVCVATIAVFVYNIKAASAIPCECVSKIETKLKVKLDST